MCQNKTWNVTEKIFGTNPISQAVAEMRAKLILVLTLRLNKNSKALSTVTNSLVLDLSGKVQSF